MATQPTQAAIDALVNSPKYAQRQGEQFGRLLVFLMNQLPRERKLPFIAGFVDVMSKALDIEPPAPTQPAKRKQGRK
jgi:hypothetical protein